MSQSLKYNLIRSFVGLAFTGLFVLLIYWAFIKALPDLTAVLKSGGQGEIANYLRGAGNVKGMLSLALLQIIQVISILFSSLPIQIAAGIVYGWFRGFIVCHLASTFAHLVVFYTVRKLDTKLDQLIPGKKKVSKLDFVINSDYPGYMIMVAFLIPLIPNGLLPYIAVKTKLTAHRYVLAVFAGNFGPVLIYCTIGHQILSGGYPTAGILFTAMFVISFLLFKFRDQVLAFLRHFLPWLFRERISEVENQIKPFE